MLGLCCYEGFALVVASKGSSPAAMHELLTVVAALFGSAGSRARLSSCSPQALEHRLNGYGKQAQLLHGT